MCSLQERERVFRASARSLSCLANRAERCESVLHSVSPPLSPDVAASSRPRRKPPSATRPSTNRIAGVGSAHGVGSSEEAAHVSGITPAGRSLPLGKKFSQRARRHLCPGDRAGERPRALSTALLSVLCSLDERRDVRRRVLGQVDLAFLAHKELAPVQTARACQRAVRRTLVQGPARCAGGKA
jgi:hypothetical protein